MKLVARLRFHQQVELLLLFVVLQSFSLNWRTVLSEKVGCLKKDRDALLSLKQDLIDLSDHLSSWRPENEDCCLWQGVNCSLTTRRVTELNLSSHITHDITEPLGGKVSPALVQLEELELLDLSDNYFYGVSFPSFNSSSFPKLTHLRLAGTGIRSSTILPHLANLSNLQFLDVSDNKYNVTSLDWLHNLSSLRFLDLSSSNLSEARDWLQVINNLPHLQNLQLKSASLPLHYSSSVNVNNASNSLVVIDLSTTLLSPSLLCPLLCNISSNLVALSLCSVGLSGSVPTVLHDIISLEHLDLSKNSFSGLIPNGVSKMTSLKHIDLSSNSFNGSIPEFFGAMSNLQTLDLSWNRLQGSFPNITGLSALKRLHLGGNHLSGGFPESLGSLSELEVLDVYYNSFDGDHMSEAHFKSLEKLVSLDLSFSSLALDLSPDWIPPFQLEFIGLSCCKLGPDVPEWLQTQSRLSLLDLSGTGISGGMPQWLSNFPNIQFLNLSHNQMNGKLPDFAVGTPLSGLYWIDLSFNQFEGPLPLFPPTVRLLNLAGNKFSGSASSLCLITGALGLLDLSNNLLSGELPYCLVFWQQLVILNLANNGFSGEFPRAIVLANLVVLDLHNNSLSGAFPLALQNSMILTFLDLRDNKLSGEIPSWIERLPYLAFLSIQGNDFHGQIPVQICNLSRLLILDMSRNELSGNIPKCFNTFTPMTRKTDSFGAFGELYYILVLRFYTQTALVKWKGREYEYGSSLKLFRIIDLASNKLSGGIPKEMMNLTELVVLNLSMNNFQGAIPRNIGQLKQLQSLDLSENRLSGMIPSGIVDLTFLSYLNLSYNNLSGQIPMGTQLETFNMSTFIGNDALCGFPLPKKCSRDNILVPPINHSNENDSDEEEFWRWFYINIGVGFVVAFWGVSGCLLLKRSWRHAYFRFLDDLMDTLYVRSVLLFAKINKTSASIRS